MHDESRGRGTGATDGAAGPSTEEPGGSYWYADADSAVQLLSALRGFRAADTDLRRRMSAGMDMNVTDLAALRFVIAHEVAEEPVTPLGLAQHLRISGASTTKLLDRLTASGHLARVPHPRDGRSRIIVATDHAHAQVRERLTRMHERMLEIARSVPEASRQDAVDFLRAMAEHLDTESVPEQLTPHVGQDRRAAR
ncbi:MarR family winged helix-turn-helix transcriptional regulator [Brachybacterium sp. YJGR34]|uniref:MarR family winged helix-turn-helix transcriptional regulator n=1 Tax=Brachybacterium sp. YJGR34 TaxID=2059911 RepID=UPI000E0AE69F|nr:MarR family transcriptional regulator [Brachybacterium sp. YJGR34]